MGCKKCKSGRSWAAPETREQRQSRENAAMFSAYSVPGDSGSAYPDASHLYRAAAAQRILTENMIRIPDQTKFASRNLYNNKIQKVKAEKPAPVATPYHWVKPTKSKQVVTVVKNNVSPTLTDLKNTEDAFEKVRMFYVDSPIVQF